MLETQNRRYGSFSGRIGMLYFNKAKRWLVFLDPPVQTDETLRHADESLDPKRESPELRTALRSYQLRVTEIGMAVVFTGLAVTLIVSSIWSFLVGSGINLVFILILLRNWFRSRSRLPIIARQCAKNIMWLFVIEAGAIVALVYVIFAEGVVIHF